MKNYYVVNLTCGDKYHQLLLVCFIYFCPSHMVSIIEILDFDIWRLDPLQTSQSLEFAEAAK